MCFFVPVCPCVRVWVCVCVCACVRVSFRAKRAVHLLAFHGIYSTQARCLFFFLLFTKSYGALRCEFYIWESYGGVRCGTDFGFWFSYGVVRHGAVRTGLRCGAVRSNRSKSHRNVPATIASYFNFTAPRGHSQFSFMRGPTGLLGVDFNSF